MIGRPIGRESSSRRRWDATKASQNLLRGFVPFPAIGDLARQVLAPSGTSAEDGGIDAKLVVLEKENTATRL